MGAMGAYLTTGRFLKLDPPPLDKADAIYVLAGDFEKKNPVAARLFREGYASQIIIYNNALFSSWSLEQNRNLYEVEWAEEDLVKRGVPRSAVVRLPFAGNGTRFEALSLMRYLRNNRMPRIILLTYDYHARRTLSTFRYILGTATQLMLVSVPAEMKPPLAQYVYLTESVKFLYYTCWLHGIYAFMAPEDRAGLSPRSRSVLPLTLFRRTVPLVVITTELKNATLGAPYGVAITIGGGVGPFGWTLEEGVLPPGLSLNPGGVIRGAPQRAGTFRFMVKVTDGADFSVRKRYAINVEIGALAITTTRLPEGRVGAAYAADLAATGGVKPSVGM